LELEVGDGFGADQDRIRGGGEAVEQLAGGAALEVLVLQGGGLADGVGVDAVEILQVGADVGEAVRDGSTERTRAPRPTARRRRDRR